MTKRPVIVALDDEKLNLMIFKKTLRARYDVVTFDDPNKLIIEITNGLDADMFLLDVQMPEIDGFSICDMIKSLPQYKLTPVMFISAGGESNLVIRGLNIGAVDFITKPIIAEEVSARVDTHIRLKTLQTNIVDRSEITAVKNTIRMLHHELNNALTAASGNVELLIVNPKVKDDEAIIKRLMKIQKAHLRMIDILRKARNLERVNFTNYVDDADMLDLDA